MDLYPRENYLKKIRDFYHETDIIKVISGVRRCGKSCLMETIAHELKESGIPEGNILILRCSLFHLKNMKISKNSMERRLLLTDRKSLKTMFWREDFHEPSGLITWLPSADMFRTL